MLVIGICSLLFSIYYTCSISDAMDGIKMNTVALFAITIFGRLVIFSPMVLIMASCVTIGIGIMG